MTLDAAIRSLPEIADRWAARVLDMGLAETWTTGCAFPTEMAYMFAWCEVLGIGEFIESGRQEGLSTLALGQWARQTGGIAHSIDFEEDPGIAAACRKRVEGLPVEMLVGDTFNVLGSTVANLTRPTGIFIDGPKHWSAMALLCAAAASAKVSFIASHNTRPGGNIRKFLENLSCVPVSYVDIVPPDLPAWKELRERELARVQTLGITGDARSTLALVPVTDENRQRIASQMSRHFRLYPPAVIRWAWKRGNAKILPRLTYASYKLFGPEYAPDEELSGAF